MSAGHELRRQIQAVRVFKLHKEGMTVRKIAELIGKQPHQVSAMVKVGERLKIATWRINQ